ncbi:MAG: hypothetical protein LC632_05780 [Xanthomonadaceae bacterium]|nr:hypothetical protein [Xanthomonadaceae bacterium]
MTNQLPPGSTRSGGVLEVLVRIIAIVATALLLVASLFVGAFVALTLLGLIAIIWLVFAIRWWYIKRRWRREAGDDGVRTDKEAGSTTVEGDFRVVDERRERNRE